MRGKNITNKFIINSTEYLYGELTPAQREYIKPFIDKKKYDEFRNKLLFEEGDEDGFISRFYNDDDVNEDGSISTSGFMGKNEIKVPYVSTLENQKHLSHGFGREYLCVGIDGERWLVAKDIFERTYEEVNK